MKTKRVVEVPVDLADDRVIKIPVAAAIAGRGYDEFRRLLKRGEGPVLTQMSEARYGVRIRHLRAWLDGRAVLPSEVAA
jgi:hypothetical protein